ncbi:hypothetical protein O2K51_13775 [Apibacter raozihei]|uniref:hypothetical protein n=1 Tax=Apibacter raozihei TaxID=2500547 RepID=UPI0013E312D9|nr:hypothetical protein [Apibacter raozihei]
MAIIKQAKNIEVKVKDRYSLDTHKLIKIADKVNVEAKYGYLKLHSTKKIQAEGNKINK